MGFNHSRVNNTLLWYFETLVTAIVHRPMLLVVYNCFTERLFFFIG